MERKKRIGFISSDPASRTGFGTCLKTLMKYLYKNYSDKYEFFVLAQNAPPTPEMKTRWPWHTTSVFECQLDQQRWAADPNYQRFIAYGNGAVKDWVVNNQLDFVFLIEDVWAFEENTYLNSNWFKHIKHNSVLWSTADSLPILDQFKKFVDHGVEFWPWASFAERELKKENSEKYNSVKTVPGAVNIDEWKPTNFIEKSELKMKFGISPDTKIIIHLGRNQLRKYFWATLEAFSKFKSRNPDKKLKLLFHTSWSEGWDLPKLIKEYGLNNEDILTSYYCRNCESWEIKPFTGENQPCKVCGGKDTMNTAGVNSTISNSDLAKIYGLCDGSISCFSSGGLELTNVQSLLCGLPLACTDYSCGTDFTEKEFVTPITGTYYREIGTGFLKHNPRIEDLVRFMNKIYDLNNEKRRKIITPAREWAMETFKVENVATHVLEKMELCQPIDWSTYHGEGGKIEQYNPNAIIDPSLEGNELVKTLYSSILGMDVDNSDQGFQGWSKQLSDGAPKDQIINYFRNVAAQEIQKLSGPKSFNDIFSEEDKEKTILIGIPKSLGDCIMVTSLLKGVQETYPDKRIYITCEPQYFSVFEGNPYVKRLIPWNGAFDNLFLLEGSGEHENLVWAYFPLHGSTQRYVDYVHERAVKFNQI